MWLGHYKMPHQWNMPIPNLNMELELMDVAVLEKNGADDQNVALSLVELQQPISIGYILLAACLANPNQMLSLLSTSVQLSSKLQHRNRCERYQSACGLTMLKILLRLSLLDMRECRVRNIDLYVGKMSKSEFHQAYSVLWRMPLYTVSFQ